MSKNNFVDAVRANLERSERERGVLLDSMQKIADAAQAEARSHLTADESKRFDEDEARLHLIDEQIASLKERDAELSEVMQRRGNAALSPVGHEFNRMRSVGDDARSTAVRNIENERRFPDAVRSAAVDVIERAGNGPIATIAATLSDPDYTTAWLKVIREPLRGHLEWSPREQAAFTKSLDLQRAMSIGTNSAGGYAVPFVLDPSIIITGTGAINPMRKLATVKQVPAGNWHGVTGAQVVASWDAEATAVSDDTPTLKIGRASCRERV